MVARAFMVCRCDLPPAATALDGGGVVAYDSESHYINIYTPKSDHDNNLKILRNYIVVWS